MWILVKFASQDRPHLYGVNHVDEGQHLATMAGVEWVSPTIGSTGAAHGVAVAEFEKILHPIKGASK